LDSAYVHGRWTSEGIPLFRFPSFEKPVDRQRYLNLEPETHEFRGVGAVLLLAATCGVALALWEPSQQVTTPFATAPASRSAPAATGNPATQETTAVADPTEDDVAPTVKLSTVCSQRATARRDCASVRALKDARLNADPAPAATKETKTSVTKPAAKKPSVAETKPTVAEAKPVVAEAKPAVTEAKPAATQGKPAVTEAKPAVTETKPAATEGKAAVVEAKPAPVEAKPAVAISKPAVTESKPAVTETKPAVTETKQAVAEAKPAPLEAKPAAVTAKAPNSDRDSVAPAASQRVSAVTPPETPAVTQPEAPAAQPQKTAAAPKAKRQRPPIPEEVVRFVREAPVREAPVERLVKVYEQVMPDGRRVPVYRRQGSGGYETGTIVDGEYRPARRAEARPRFFGLQ
jgi:hypothetical protein